MSAADILAKLPNGMHDASISNLRVEFGHKRVTLDMEFWVGDLDAEDEAKREAYRVGRLVLTGVVAMLLDPPDPADSGSCFSLDEVPMRDLSEISLDSQCLTYLISALEGVAAPTDSLAEQKVALVRLYLYTPGTVWVTPTVKREFLRIRDEARRASHITWTSVLFGVRPLNDAAAVERRAASLEPLHADFDDRLVLAESEDIGFATLVSFDARFVNHLSNHARLLLTEPAALWASLGIPRGARPDKVPAFGNPLASETWWRW